MLQKTSPPKVYPRIVNVVPKILILGVTTELIAAKNAPFFSFDISRVRISIKI